MQQTKHIDVKFFSCICVAHLLNRGEMGVSGVVYNDIDPAKLLPGLVKGSFYRVLVLDVQRERQKAVTFRAKHVYQCLSIPAGGRHRIPLLQQFFDQRMAQPFRTACYKPNFFTCHLFSFLSKSDSAYTHDPRCLSCHRAISRSVPVSYSEQPNGVSSPPFPAGSAPAVPA